MIQLKRIYDPSKKEDGLRVLVDRLWPRGVSKEKAKLDLWMKEIAPSDSLRKWFGHEPDKWDEFQSRYKKELEEKKELLQELRLLEQKHKIITLLFAAKDTKHNNAVVIQSLL